MAHDENDSDDNAFVSTVHERPKRNAEFALMRANVAPHFDSNFYLTDNEDVRRAGLDPIDHYLSVGWKEKRRPAPYFDSDYYLKKNEDVRRRGTNPFYHFLVIGKAEGRLPAAPKNAERELKAPIVSEYHFVREIVDLSFDYAFYLREYQDVAVASGDAVDHYLLKGWKEGRKPRPDFDSEYYLQQNDDVRRSNVNPFYHYLVAGKSEGRLPAPPVKHPPAVQTATTPPTDDPSSDPQPTGVDHDVIRKSLDPHFDREFYLNLYDDIRNAGIDPLEHYIWTGWREGRQPSADFEPAFYLAQNDDVRAAGINPFYHYVITGKSQGRAALRPALDRSNAHADANFKLIREAVEPYFDKESYLDLYTDVRDAKVDPVDHYLMTGWKEGRDPSWEFDTSFYLETYQDIKDAGVNPYFHYLVTGKAEGRKPKDEMSAEVAVLQDSDSPREKARGWIRSKLPKPLLLPALRRLIALQVLDKALGNCLSISHDNYTKVIGGIQNCLSEEQRLFNESRYNYFQVFPAQPLPKLSDETKSSSALVTLTANGRLVGTATLETVTAALKDEFAPISRRSEGVGTRPEAILVIHSLLGHSPEALLRTARALGAQKKYFWLHDYFSLCEGYTLMRNDLTFCNAPSATSQACQVCTYGAERKSHQNRILEFFDQLRPTVVSPSAAALEVWRNKEARFPVADEIILDHCTLEFPKARRKARLRVTVDQSAIRVGFLGFDKFHKGWSTFERLATAFYADGVYSFSHLGGRRKRVPFISFVPVEVTALNPDAMILAMSSNNLDAAIIWPKWPETFCFVCYEAMAAGTLVITHRQSGNVAKAVERFDAGVVLENEDALHEYFRSGALRESCLERRGKPRAKAQLKYSGCTASLVERDPRSVK